MLEVDIFMIDMTLFWLQVQVKGKNDSNPDIMTASALVVAEAARTILSQK